MVVSTSNSVHGFIRRALESGDGILRLAPTWVPRPYIIPRRRMKLDPRDLYAYGAHRGGTGERWIASTTFEESSVGLYRYTK